MKSHTISVQVKINSDIDTVWMHFTDASSITKWCFATDTWHAPSAVNDLKVGGRFTTRMEAKDGSFGFDFSGVYLAVTPKKLIEYKLDDGREVITEFLSHDHITTIIQTFEPEKVNPEEMQRAGWQAILDSFKSFIENL